MKIKLAKLPDARIVKVTIALPAELRRQLDRYAEFYSRTWAHEMDAIGLIPHMLAQFLANDRAFRKEEHARLPRESRVKANNEDVV